MSELKVTSLQDLQRYQQGAIIELPPFAENQPFVARLRRPSMLVLVKSGKIPNELLVSANDLFAKGGEALTSDDEGILKKVFGVMDSLCEASFVEPSYKEMKEAGIELTDEQMMFVFEYAQAGVRALKSFRPIEEHNERASDGETI